MVQVSTPSDPVFTNSIYSFGYDARGQLVKADFSGDSEGGLALTTENKDDEKPQNNVAQSVDLHGRYKINPIIGLGALFNQSDYSALAQSNEARETESSYGLILESAIADKASVEVALISTSNSGGTKGESGTTISIEGFYKVAPKVQLGLLLQNSSFSGDTTEASINSLRLLVCANF